MDDINRQRLEIYSLLTELVSVAKKLGVAEETIKTLRDQQAASTNLIRSLKQSHDTVFADAERMGADLAKRRKGDDALTELYQAADALFNMKKMQNRLTRSKAMSRLSAALIKARDHVDLIPF